jgi:ATP-dependent Lon protease
VRNHGLTAEQIEFQPAAVSAIIRGYTREAGVRNLEREIGALCRKIARRRAEGDERRAVITPELVLEMLGAPTFLDEEIENRTKDPGVAVGLAWTPAGGEVLFVEASRMQGGGSLTLTGHLGDVMKESARTALSWFRANAVHYGVDPAFYKDAEIHLHVPSGAVPKDGPSAGVTMVSALASELTGRPVRGDIAMTGEISHSVRCLAVCGLMEIEIAARRHGITELILPKPNEKNVNEDLTEDLRRELKIHFVTEISEVLAIALTPSPQQTRTPMPVETGTTV